MNSPPVFDIIPSVVTLELLATDCITKWLAWRAVKWKYKM